MPLRHRHFTRPRISPSASSNDAPVDVFFGRIMQIDERAGAPVDFATEMRKLHRAGRRFINSIKAIEPSNLAGERLDLCQREYERLWDATGL